MSKIERNQPVVRTTSGVKTSKKAAQPALMKQTVEKIVEASKRLLIPPMHSFQKTPSREAKLVAKETKQVAERLMHSAKSRRGR